MSPKSTDAVAVIDATAASPELSELLRTPVCGAALFLHAVYTASSTDSIGRVVLVSNDAEICAMARQQEIEVVHAERVADAIPQATAEVVVLLSARAPLVTPEDLEACIEIVPGKIEDGIFAQVDAPGAPESGALYVFLSEAFRKNGRFEQLTLAPMRLTTFHSLRVSSMEDLQPLAALLRRQPLDFLLRKHPAKALVLDFDGVFTDNKVIVSAEGAESAICDRSDGFAIQSLQRRGFPILVLSTEKIPIVKMRSQKLGLECIHGVGDKLSILRDWLKSRKVTPEETIYVGNDVNDVECMKAVGLPIAVADAFPEARAVARHILASRGGHGAVREIAMAVAAALDRDPSR